jgi:hypothetical protein
MRLPEFNSQAFLDFFVAGYEFNFFLLEGFSTCYTAAPTITLHQFA